MKTKIYLIAGIFILIFHSSIAQNKWEVQFRPVLNFTTEDFAGANIKTGFGFELAGAYHFTPRIGLYGGLGWNEFRADDPLGNSKFDVEETGYSFGLQYKSPIPNSPLSYFLRPVQFITILKLKISNGNIMRDSGYGLGWQASAGLELGIGGDLTSGPQYATAPYQGQ